MISGLKYLELLLISSVTVTVNCLYENNDQNPPNAQNLISTHHGNTTARLSTIYSLLALFDNFTRACLNVSPNDF